MARPGKRAVQTRTAPPPGRPAPPARPKNWMLFAALGAAAFLLTVAVYARVVGFGFVNYDDPEYTYDNPHVNAGLTVAGVRWAFGNSYAANWHPLTWISHML